MTPLSPSFEALCLLLRPHHHPADQERLRQLLPRVDWAHITDVSLRSAVPGILLDAVNALELRLPHALGLRLATSCLVMEQQTQALMVAADGIHGEAQRRGLHVVPLKGAALLFDGPYVRNNQRGMADVDLLVADEDRPAVIAIVEALGFARRQPAAASERHDHDALYAKQVAAPYTLFVELHWTPYYEFGTVEDARAALQRSHLHQHRGRSWRLLDREDNLLVLLLHLAHNRFRAMLRSVVDIAWYLDAYAADLDWLELDRRARHLGATTAVRLALELTHRWMDSPLPPRHPAPRSWRRDLITHLCELPEAIVPPQPLGGFGRRLAIDLLLQDHPSRQVRQLVHKTSALVERWSGPVLPDFLVRRAGRR